MTGTEIYGANTSEEEIRRLLRIKSAPGLEQVLGSQFRELLEGCLAVDPKARLTAEQIVLHPLFSTSWQLYDSQTAGDSTVHLTVSWPKIWR